jgi:GDP-L-fucose synthase
MMDAVRSTDIVDGFATERVLVTGSGGVLGTALARLLRSVPVAALLTPRRADWDLLDERSAFALWQTFQPTIVFHLAAWVAGIQGNLAFAGQAFYDNARMNLNVVEAARRFGTRKVIAAGTTAAYPDGIALPMREDDLWAGPPHPSEGPYGHAKRAMLAHLEAYQRQYGLDYAFAICTNLYGPHDRFDERYGHVVPSLVKRFHDARAQGLDEISIWGDGTPTRDLLHADDAARGFVVAALNGSGALNLATGHAVTIRTLVEVLTEVSGYRGDIRWDNTKPNGQVARSYDTGRARALGWHPEVSLPEGLRQTYDWYTEHHAAARH